MDRLPRLLVCRLTGLFLLLLIQLFSLLHYNSITTHADLCSYTHARLVVLEIARCEFLDVKKQKSTLKGKKIVLDVF